MPCARAICTPLCARTYARTSAAYCGATLLWQPVSRRVAYAGKQCTRAHTHTHASIMSFTNFTINSLVESCATERPMPLALPLPPRRMHHVHQGASKNLVRGRHQQQDFEAQFMGANEQAVFALPTSINAAVAAAAAAAAAAAQPSNYHCNNHTNPAWLDQTNRLIAAGPFGGAPLQCATKMLPRLDLCQTRPQPPAPFSPLNASKSSPEHNIPTKDIIKSNLNLSYVECASATPQQHGERSHSAQGDTNSTQDIEVDNDGDADDNDNDDDDDDNRRRGRKTKIPKTVSIRCEQQ